MARTRYEMPSDFVSVAIATAAAECDEHAAAIRAEAMKLFLHVQQRPCKRCEIAHKTGAHEPGKTPKPEMEETDFKTCLEANSS